MTVRRLILHPLWLFLALPGYIGWRLLSGLNFGPVAISRRHCAADRMLPVHTVLHANPGHCKIEN